MLLLVNKAPHKSGFKSGDSTETTLLSLTETRKKLLRFWFSLCLSFDSQPLHPSPFSLSHGHPWRSTFLV